MAQQLEWKNFEFVGVDFRGSCLVRVQINDDGTLVVLVAQLRDYYGKSVTNAIEDILVTVARKLESAKVLTKHFNRPWYNRGPSVVERIRQRSKVIEHYPAGTSVRPEGTFALVHFDANLSPSWQYLSQSNALQISNVDPSFLVV